VQVSTKLRLIAAPPLAKTQVCPFDVSDTVPAWTVQPWSTPKQLNVKEMEDGGLVEMVEADPHR